MKTTTRIRSTTTIAVTCLAFHLAHAAPFTFTPLGDLSGGTFQSYAHGISADGSVVVGRAHGSSGHQAFRWTSGSGMVGLGDLSGGSFFSEARDVSADGSVIVGRGRSTSGDEAFRWTSGGGMVGLGDLSGGNFDSIAYGVSANGLIVVGEGNTGSTFVNFDRAFRLVGIGSMVSLGILSSPSGPITPSSQSNDVSADGSVVVGESLKANGSLEAFRWTSSGGMVGLGDLSGPGTNSRARGVSADGSVVVGSGTGASGTEAFLWTSGSGMVGLGDLSGGTFNSHAYAVSDDGSVVVGHSTSGSGQEAFFWTSSNGMQNLRETLVAAGVTGLTGWKLTQATSVSADGMTIVGYGTNPAGNTEAWLATVPEPSTALLAFTGVLACCVRRRRMNP